MLLNYIFILIILKDGVNELREKEGREELKGFGLTALSKDELGMVQQTIQDNFPATKKYHFSKFWYN